MACSPRHPLARVLAGSLLFVVTTGNSGAGARQPGGGPPPARVVLDKARIERIEQQRMVTGELQATRRALLATQEQGWVVEFSVREGDLIEAGGVVARLDDKLLDLEV